MSSSPDPKDVLREYVVGQGVAADAGEIRDDDDLLTNGLIDSLGLLDMVGFIEERFDVEVADTDVTVNNFRSLKDIANYLEARRSQRLRTT
jgi:acyl carrier protein